MKKQKKTNWWNALKLFFEWNGKKWDWNGIARARKKNECDRKWKKLLIINQSDRWFVDDLCAGWNVIMQLQMHTFGHDDENDIRKNAIFFFDLVIGIWGFQ